MHKSPTKQKNLFSNKDFLRSVHQSAVIHHHLHGLIEVHAFQNPHDTAIIWPRSQQQIQKLSFQELNQAANQLAQSLRERGISIYDSVGINLSRCPSVVISMLAVLKLGATWVPLDPEFPNGKLHDFAKQANLKLILGPHETRLFWKTTAFNFVDIDQLTDASKGKSKDDLNINILENSPAYVIFTSGSTGRSKAVVGTHHAMISRLRWMWQHYPYRDGEIEVQKKSLNFVGSISELFGALGGGIPVVLMPPLLAKDPTSWPAFVNRHDITRLWIMPTLLKILLDGSSETMPKLLYSISSGEILDPTLSRGFYERAPNALLLNFYGSTELASDIMDYQVPRNPRNGENIGIPMHGNRAYLLDKALEPAAKGETGQLYFSGPFLCSGYRGKPALTASRFLPNPFSKKPGTRMYETGDLAKKNLQNQYLLYGRKDHLIKVRGHRIEPAQVEMALRSHPGVRDAAINALPDKLGSQALVAYIIPKTDDAMTSDTLRNHLSQLLPPYMVPDRYLRIENIPLTTNGKINRNMLPIPEGTRPNLSTPLIPPQGEREEGLAKLWSELLGIEPIGREDSFFHLGGHSLMAARLIVKIRDKYRKAPSLETFIKKPTLAALSEWLNGHRGVDLVKLADPPAKIRLPHTMHSMWLSHKLHQKQATQTLVHAFHIEGIHAHKLSLFLSQIFQAHHTFKARVMEEKGSPYMTFDGLLPNIRILPMPEEKSGLLEQHIQRLQNQRFKLKSGPLAYALILEHLDACSLLLAQHHLITDGWSIDLFCKELLAKIQGIQQPSPHYHFDHFMYFESTHQDDSAFKEKTQKLEEAIHEFVPVTLPTDCQSNQHVHFSNSKTFQLKLSHEYHQQINQFTQCYHVTPFNLFLTAFCALTYRCTGVTKQIIGLPHANRNLPFTDEIIGCLLKSIPLLMDLNPDLSIEALVLDMKQQADAHLNGITIPVQALPRDKAPHHMLAYQNTPERQSARCNETIRQIPVPDYFAQHPLTLEISEDKHCFEFFLIYQIACYSDQRVKEYGDYFRTLLQNILQDPQLTLRQLSMLPEQALLNILNQGSGELLEFENRHLHQRFEDMTHICPDRPALHDATKSLTYRELNEQANYLANSLSARGIALNDTVPVLMDKHANMVISWLALLKCGAAFVPIDPNWPGEHMDEIFKQLQMKMIVSEPGNAVNASLAGVEVFHPPMNLRAKKGPSIKTPQQSPIYAMFTSGSTGKSKGVLVPHEGINNRFYWMDRYFGSEPPPIVLQTTPQIFDSVVWELFWPLTLGGATVLAPHTRLLDGPHLANLIYRYQVTVLDSVPSVFRALAPSLVEDHEARQLIKSLQVVILGSEALPIETAQLIKMHLPNIRLINLYGPTEASIGCICYEVTGAESEMPIGNPIANVRTVILDPDGHPLPKGLKGELHLGGPCLAKGYLNNPEKTDQQFIASPFHQLNCDRLYRTGDLVSMNPSGQYLFHGRIDNQLKINGIRIEPAEIEAILNNHPQIAASCVCAIGPTNSKALEAAIRPRHDEIQVEEIKKYLRNRLPQSMIPTAYHTFQDLPRTKAGKMDRKQIAHNLTGLRNKQKQAIAPRSQRQALLLKLWSDILDATEIGITDNFFDLGGHSLHAMLLIGKIQQHFGVLPSHRYIFEHPTISELSEHIEALSQNQNTIDPRPAKAPVRLSFTQERIWFIEYWRQEEGRIGSPAFNMSRAYALPPGTRPERLEEAIRDLAETHPIWCRPLAHKNGVPHFQAPQSPPPLRVIDLSDLPSNQASRRRTQIFHNHAEQPIPLTKGPLAHMAMVLMPNQQDLLFWTMHHIVGDAWSLDLFGTWLYKHLQNHPLPTPSIGFEDYSHWEKSQVGHHRSQLNHLLKELRDAPRLHLPYEKRNILTHGGGAVSFSISQEKTNQLFQLGRTHHCSLFQILTTIIAIWLNRYDQGDDISLGVPVQGRYLAETQNMPGPFLNTAILRLRLNSQEGFLNALKITHQQALHLQDNAKIPFEQLLRHLQPERDEHRPPLFDVAINYLESTTQPKPGQLNPVPITRPERHAHLPITLYIQKTPHQTQMKIVYDKAHFSHGHVERMGLHLRRLITAVIEEPTRPLFLLPMLSRREISTLVHWNHYHSEIPSTPLSEIVLVQAQRKGQKPALFFTSTSQRPQIISYASLARRVYALSSQIQRLALRPEEPIGICMERCPEMIMAVLAVNHVGGCFVPIDPAFPKKRRDQIFDDANIRICLASSKTASSLSNRKLSIIVPDSSISIANSRHEVISNQQAAYIMYTTGSTGKPKGVVGSHRAMINRLYWWWNQFPFAEDEVCTFKKSLNFIGAIPEIFDPLGKGMPLVIMNDAQAQNPRSWGSLINKHQISRLWAMPSLIQTMLNGLSEEEELPSLKYCVTSGESLPELLNQQFRLRLPRTQLLNIYGSTELTSDVAFHPSIGNDADVVGRPVNNVSLHILGPHLEQLPMNVEGQLYVGGAHPARCYYNAPVLTAQSFLPDPHDHRPGSRIFRTGDRAYRDQSGNVHILGRADQIVKIRGFRIDPREVKEVILSHQDIQDAAVLKKGTTENPFLVAYLHSSTRDQEPSIIKNHLYQNLPSYMVPARILFLPEIPRTTNGKVDLQSLPEDTKVQKDYQPPQGQLENQLAQLWSQHLKINAPGRDDNFFELGGHSLLAIEILAQLKQFKETQLKPQLIFQAPTIASLALKLQKMDSQAFKPVPKVQNAPMSFQQQRFCFDDPLSLDNTYYHLWSLRPLCLTNRDLLQQKAKRLIMEQTILRTGFNLEQKEMVVLSSRDFKIPIIDLQGLPRSDQKRSIGMYIANPYDLESGYPWRPALFQIAKNAYLFLNQLHHLVGDGQTLHLLDKALNSAPEDQTLIRPTRYQYADISFNQHDKHLEGEYDESLEFWENHLSDYQPMPLPKTEHKEPSSEAQTVSFNLSQKESQKLEELARHHSTSLFTVLLARLHGALLLWQESKDIMTGLIYDTRTPLTRDMPGLFLNVLCFRSKNLREAHWQSMIPKFNDDYIGCLEHSQVPFSLIRKACLGDQLPQVVFNHTGPQSQSTSPIKPQLPRNRQPAAKYPIALYTSQTQKGIKVRLVYQKQRFSQFHIQNLIDTFKKL